VRKISTKRQLEQLMEARQARQAQQNAALGRFLALLAPEEIVALEATLEADLAGQLVPQAIEQQVDNAFTRAWAMATPEDRSLLIH
jgi:hypothetical protein